MCAFSDRINFYTTTGRIDFYIITDQIKYITHYRDHYKEGCIVRREVWRVSIIKFAATPEKKNGLQDFGEFIKSLWKEAPKITVKKLKEI